MTLLTRPASTSPGLRRRRNGKRKRRRCGGARADIGRRGRRSTTKSPARKRQLTSEVRRQGGGGGEADVEDGADTSSDQRGKGSLLRAMDRGRRMNAMPHVSDGAAVDTTRQTRRRWETGKRRNKRQRKAGCRRAPRLEWPWRCTTRSVREKTRNCRNSQERKREGVGPLCGRTSIPNAGHDEPTDEGGRDDAAARAEKTREKRHRTGARRARPTSVHIGRRQPKTCGWESNNVCCQNNDPVNARIGGGSGSGFRKTPLIQPQMEEEQNRDVHHGDKHLLLDKPGVEPQPNQIDTCDCQFGRPQEPHVAPLTDQKAAWNHQAHSRKN